MCLKLSFWQNLNFETTPTPNASAEFKENLELSLLHQDKLTVVHFNKKISSAFATWCFRVEYPTAILTSLEALPII